MGLFLYVALSFAKSHECNSKLEGYKVVPNSHLSFSVGGRKACFFAFYTPNPALLPYEGNIGDALWYGYYELQQPNKIYEFTKSRDNFWTAVCSIEAISFENMYGGKIPAVAILGSCNKNTSHYIHPLVFVRRDAHYYDLDDRVYFLGVRKSVGLSIADLRAYTKALEYIDILKKRVSY